MIFLVVGAAVFVCSAFAWFIVNNTTTATSPALPVRYEGVSDISCKLYRSDGAYYDAVSDSSYEGDGSVMTEVFSMLEYDTIITQKNRVNNLVMRIEVAFFDETDENVLIEFFARSIDPFIVTADGAYALSDIIKVSAIFGLQIDATEPAAIYSAATTAFNSVTDAEKLRFASLQADGTYTKVAQLDFTHSLVERKATAFFNIEYDESLVRHLYGDTYGSFDWTDEDRLHVVSDLEFSVKATGGAA